MQPSSNNIHSSSTLYTETILVVDDDPAQSLLLKSTLEKRGYTVLEANSGKDAISIFEQHHPIMILLDAVMPEMDGFETCRRIRALEKGEDSLIFMITSLNDEESVKLAFNVGAVDFITKPIYWSVLLVRVEYFFKAKTGELKIRRIEDQLHHARKMEAIGNLTNGIAHKFNNILMSILGYSDLLLNTDMENKTDKTEQYLKQISKSAKRAHDVVTQMQAFTNKAISHSVILNPSTLLDDTVRILRPALADEIELHLEVKGEFPTIKIDPVKFQQLILNLLTNATESMDNSGRINIELQKTVVSDIYCASCHKEINGEYIELSISDTGTGIEKSIQNKMFDPYYSSKPFGEASGMGLSVVHGIVHEYEGHIQVVTSLTEGTEFKIFFPACKQNIPATEKINDADDDKSLNAESELHILVVDDEEVVGTYEAEYLQIHGYKTTHISDPMQAIETISATPNKFDLVITDKNMPRLDGLELAGAIMAVRADLPIILCTGYSGSLPDIDLKCIGIRAQLEKPVKGVNLLKTIRSVLEKND